MKRLEELQRIFTEDIQSALELGITIPVSPIEAIRKLFSKNDRVFSLITEFCDDLKSVATQDERETLIDCFDTIKEQVKLFDEMNRSEDTSSIQKVFQIPDGDNMIVPQPGYMYN